MTHPFAQICEVRCCSSGVFENGLAEIAIHTGDEIEAYLFRADGFAGTRHRAIAESLRVHGGDHVGGSAVAFCLALRKQAQMGNLRGDKEHR